MRKLLLAATALVGISTGSVTAHAALITGQISFGGAASYSTSGSTVTIDFGSSASVTPTTASGDFSSAFSTGCLSCATFTDFSYTGVGAVTPFQLYTATLDGLTTTFLLEAITYSVTTANEIGSYLNVEASGVLTLTGYDATPGIFTFSAQPGTQTVTVSFSATSSAVAIPEPASLALFGTGLLGLGIVGRFRSRSRDI